MHEQQQRFALGERQEVDVPCAEARKENKKFFLAAYSGGQFPQHTSQALSIHTFVEWMSRIPKRLRGTRS